MSSAEEKMAMMQGEMDNLQQKIAILEQALKDLQQDRRVPTQPWDVSPGWNPSTPYGPTKTECPKCGLKMEGPIGYVCPHINCPCGLGGVFCGTGVGTLT